MTQENIDDAMALSESLEAEACANIRVSFSSTYVRQIASTVRHLAHFIRDDYRDKLKQLDAKRTCGDCNAILDTDGPCPSCGFEKALEAIRKKDDNQ